MLSSKEIESIYGKQSISDNSFTAKARLLQSIWREESGFQIGIGPNRGSVAKNTELPTYYGNMILDGERNGNNFFYPQTFEYAKKRVTEKKKDETIDEYRLYNNLMSSMPMAFNLFHPLMMLQVQQPAALDKMIQNAFPNFPIHKIKEIGLEFIPTPIEHYTNDKSAMDASISFWDKDGGEYIIAIETKYTDSLGTNTSSDKVFNKQIDILRNLNLFTPEAIDKLTEREIPISQIYRNFMLTEKYRQVQVLKDSYSIILAPKNHPSTVGEIRSLKQYLKNEDSYKLTDYKLEDFVSTLISYCPVEYLEWLNWFYDRYLNFEKLNKLYSVHTTP